MADDQNQPDIGMLQGNARWRAAYQYFVSKGWSPAQSAGIVGGLQGETNGLNPVQTHDNGRGLGIAGWNGDRLTGLIQFAGAQDKSPTDLQTQLDYVDHELRTSESGAGNLISASTTPQQAGHATLAYFRPSNWNLPGAHPERAQNASNFYNTFNRPQTGSGCDKFRYRHQTAQAPNNQALGFAGGTQEPDFIPQLASARAATAPDEPDFVGQLTPPAKAPAQATPPVTATPAAPVNPNAQETLPQYTNRLEAEHQGNTWTDAGIRAGAGVMRGVGDVADTLGQGIAAAGDTGAGLLAKLGVISPQTAQGVSDWRTGVNAGITEADQGFTKAAGDSGLASGGRLVGQIAGTAPFLAAGAAALPEMAPATTYLGGLVRAAGAGAAYGAGATALTSAASPEPIGEQVLQGAKTGAILGPAGKLAGDAGGAVAGKLADLVRPNIPQNIIDLAQKAQQYGIRLLPSQLTGAVGHDLPSTAQISDLHSALGREIGVTTDHLDMPTVNGAIKTIRQQYQAINSQLGDIPADQTFLNSINRVGKNTDFKKISNIVDDINGRIDPKTGFIDASDHQQIMRQGGDLDSALNSRDPAVKQEAMQIKSAMDGVLRRTNPDLAAERDAADYKYWVANTLKDNMLKSPTRDLDLSGLNREAGDSPTPFGDISRIGKQFLSATPKSLPQLMLQSAGQHLGKTALTGAGLGALGASAYFDPDSWQRDALGAGGLLALGATGRMIQNMRMRSPGLAEKLINRASTPSATGGHIDKLLNLLPSAAPTAGALINRPNIVVTPRPGYYSQPGP